MAAYIFSVVVLFLVAVLLNYCAAVGITYLMKKNQKAVSMGIRDDIKAEFTSRVMNTMKECAAQHNTNQKELMEAAVHPADFPADAHKCAWACIFKKLGLIDSKGMYLQDAAIEIIKKYSKGQKLEEGLAAAKKCISVNDQSVGDGAEGCDRAKLLVDCILKDLL